MQRLAVLFAHELFLEPREGVEGKMSLGGLRRAEHAGLGDQAGPQVDAVLLLEAVADILEKQIVEIVAAELSVAVAGQHLDDAGLGLDNRHIEGAAAQVIDEHALEIALARVVGERGGGRLVQNPHTFQAGQLAGLTRRLPLGVVEVGGDRDHGLTHVGADLLRRPLAQRPQDHRRDFLRPVLLVAELDLHVLAHLPLDRFDGALRRQHPLVLGRLADQQPPVLGQPDKGRQDGITLLGEDMRLTIANQGHLAVGRAEIDSYDGFHQ